MTSMHNHQAMAAAYGAGSAASHMPSSRYVLPDFEERTPYGYRRQNPYTKLFEDRIVFLGVQVDDASADDVMAQLLVLEAQDSDRDITMYINSPGGSVYAGLGIYDTMQYITPDVATICTGMAASMGAVLLVAGAKGKRAALKHSRVMIHQPSGGAQGVASDMEINLREMLKLKKELYDIISSHSGQSYEWVEKASDRDYWMTSAEAKDFGMIDEVLGGTR